MSKTSPAAPQPPEAPPDTSAGKEATPGGAAVGLPPRVVSLMFFDHRGKADCGNPLWLRLREVAHTAFEQRLVRVAGHVLVEARTTALGVAHLAQHSAVG